MDRTIEKLQTLTLDNSKVKTKMFPITDKSSKPKKTIVKKLKHIKHQKLCRFCRKPICHYSLQMEQDD